MMIGRMVMTCPKDGGAGDERASVQTLEKVKEKQESPTMMIGRIVTTCLRMEEQEIIELQSRP